MTRAWLSRCRQHAAHMANLTTSSVPASLSIYLQVVLDACSYTRACLICIHVCTLGSSTAVDQSSVERQASMHSASWTLTVHLLLPGDKKAAQILSLIEQDVPLIWKHTNHCKFPAAFRKQVRFDPVLSTRTIGCVLITWDLVVIEQHQQLRLHMRPALIDMQVQVHC